ncbi:hypothetical protein [Azospirillum doebereinerae]
MVGEAHGGRGAVAAAARRHGVCTSLIYRWRRQLEAGELSAQQMPATSFFDRGAGPEDNDSEVETDQEAS